MRGECGTQSLRSILLLGGRAYIRRESDAAGGFYFARYESFEKATNEANKVDRNEVTAGVTEEDRERLHLVGSTGD